MFITLLYKMSQCCGSGMFIPDPNFYIPDPDPRSKVKKIPDPGSRIRIRFKEFKFLTQQVVPKLEEI